MRKLLLMTVLLLSAVAASGGEFVSVDGTTHVKNGAEPAQGVKDLEMVEQWRAGGADDEEVFFGVVTQVESDTDGNLYLLDTQLSQVMVFDADGAMTGTLSRPGEGPGEVNIPADMCFMPDGSLGLMQSFPGKVVKVSLDDSPMGNLVPGGGPAAGGFLLMRDINSSGDQLVGCGEMIRPNEAQTGQTRTAFLSAFDADGNKTATFLEKSREWEFASGNFTWDEAVEYFVHYRKWDTGPDSRIYAAPSRDNYEIHVWKTDGTLDRIIEREYERWVRTDEENELVDKAMENLKRQFGGIPVETKVSEFAEAVNSLFVSPDNELWVLTNHGIRDLPEGVMNIYDVFDAEGHYDRQVKIKCDGNGEQDALMFTRDGRVVVVTGFMDAVTALQGGGAAEEGEEEAEPMEVICYSVK